MRHRIKKLKIGIDRDHTKAMLRNLVTSLVMHGRLRTTKKRAKALTMAFSQAMRLVKKRSHLEAIRNLPQFVTTQAASRKLLGELKARYEDKVSGFTSISTIGHRIGDDAHMVMIELIGGKEPTAPQKEARKTKGRVKKVKA